MKTMLLKTLLLFGLALAGSAALADPPARVGRIAYVQGEVDFRPAYDGEAEPAQQNWPVTSHNTFTTGPDARVELRVGSSAIRLDADSELEIAELDDSRFRLRLLYGSLNARVKGPDLVQDFELNTAQGQLTLTAPSQLHAESGRSPGSTSVSLFSGAAHLASAQSAFMLVAGQRAILANGTLQMGAAVRDDFDFWSLARDQRDDQSVSARYVSPELTGYEALDEYGSWNTTVEYGVVWIPQAVPVGWAPYRNGRWAWIEPWGWTWVDNAPWGYAPFHYGRWAWFNQRWCWVPGRAVARPIWAPALVGWVGGDNWNIRFSIGSAPAVGWFPLAPYEAYQPGYAASPTYVSRINLYQDGRRGREPRAAYRDRLQHHAVTVIPHERFRQQRTIAVTTAPTVVGTPQQLSSAPLAAALPASIARPPAAAPRTLREPPAMREPARQAAPLPAPGGGPILAAPAPERPAQPGFGPGQRFGAVPPASERRPEAAARPMPPEHQSGSIHAGPATSSPAPPAAPARPAEREPIRNAPRMQPQPQQMPAPAERQSGSIHVGPAAPSRTPPAAPARPAEREPIRSAPRMQPQQQPRQMPAPPGRPSGSGYVGSAAPAPAAPVAPRSERAERRSPIEAGPSRQQPSRQRDGERPARGGDERSR